MNELYVLRALTLILAIVTTWSNAAGIRGTGGSRPDVVWLVNALAWTAWAGVMGWLG